MACLTLASLESRQWGSEERRFSGEVTPVKGKVRKQDWAGSESSSFFKKIFMYLFGCAGSSSPHVGSSVLVVALRMFLLVAYKLVATCGIEFPDQASNQGLRHWERRVPATGPPGKTQCQTLFFFFFASKQLSLLFAQGQLLQALRPQDFQKGWGMGVSHPASQVLPAPSCFLQEMGE